VAILGGAASKDSGSLGHATFKVLEDVSTETVVELTYASYESEVEVGSGGAKVLIGGTPTEPSAPSPDFDGNGEVGFSDFIQFARVFGAKEGDGKYDRKYDLDENGDIGFSDFIQFARVFGKKVEDIAAGKPAGAYLPGANVGAGLSLAPVPGASSDESVLVVGLTGAGEVSGYSLRVKYDASALEFLSATGVSGSLFAGAPGSQEVALQASAESGEVVLADALRSEAVVQGEGDLVRLRFRVLDGTVAGSVEIVEAQVSDGLGRIDTLVGAYAAEVRLLPTEYSLSQNYPDPFNPETAVPFALPEGGDVRLSVYNVLGQEVAVLVSGRLEAGYHRVVWDGRDLRGRAVSSGIYFVRMVTDGFSDVRKMLLLK